MLRPALQKKGSTNLIAKKGLTVKKALEEMVKVEKKMISAFWKTYGGLAKKRFLDVYKKDWEKFSDDNFDKFLKI